MTRRIIRKRIRAAYSKLNNISFDYGVLEKTQSIYAVKGDFDWDDVGSLEALSKTLERDENGNAVWGAHFSLDTHDSVIYSNGIFIATIGIRDMIVVAADDALIVCPRERAQDIKPFVMQLGHSGMNEII